MQYNSLVELLIRMAVASLLSGNLSIRLKKSRIMKIRETFVKNIAIQMIYEYRIHRVHKFKKKIP